MAEKKTPETKAADTATQADREAMKAGTEQPTHTDRDRENTPQEDRIEGLTKQFEEQGQTKEEAAELARSLVEYDLSYQFNSIQLDGYQIFNVRSQPRDTAHQSQYRSSHLRPHSTH